MEEDLLVKLSPKFQKILFQKVIDKYHGSISASKILKIPPSSIRGYKNLYFDSIPKKLIDRLINFGFVTSKEIEENLISTFTRKEIVSNILNSGRNKRIMQLRGWKEEIPSLNDVYFNSNLDLEKWFLSYQKLINFGPRKFNYVKRNKDYLKISYKTHSNKNKKDFIIYLPRNINVDKEFIYFFGLWCGDRSGGKRLGICNQNDELISFTEHFLKNRRQKVEKILYLTKMIPEPKIKYDKKFVINKNIKGWVLSVHTINGVLTSFFQFLQNNLEDFLKKINNKNIFFAGLFDAEGNVSLYNRSLRLACKNDNLVKIYVKFLQELNLYDKYDGNSLIIYNIKEFYDAILPYMRHEEKINRVKFLYDGKGKLPTEFIRILSYIKNNPAKTEIEIAKALKKNKVYSELKLLAKYEFIIHENYPYRFKINNKGLKSLGE